MGKIILVLGKYFLVIFSFVCICENVFSQKLLSEGQEEYIDTTFGYAYTHIQNDLYLEINPLGQLQIYKYATEEIKILSSFAEGLNKLSAGYSDFFAIDSMTAYTFVPHKKKYKAIKSADFSTQNNTSKGVFYDDSKLMTAKFLNVTKGAYIQLKYKEIIKDPHMIRLNIYQNYKYCRRSIYRIFVQDDIKISLNNFNFEGFNITSTETKQGKYTVYTLCASDVKAYLDKASSPGYLHILPHSTVDVVSYTYKNKTTPILGSTKSLYAWYMLLVKENINKEYPELKIIADSITKNISTENEKVKAIYKWVQNQISYVAFEHGLGGFIPRPSDLVCSRKFGDCKDMAMLIYKLLQSINIKTGITWIGTRELPYSYSQINSPTVDNHMITSYKNKDGEWIFLDGTSKHCQYGMPSGFIQGKEALISINDTTFEVVKVPVVDAKYNLNIDSVKITISKDELVFIGVNTLTGYSKGDVDDYFDNYGQNKGKEITQAILKKGSDKFTINSHEYKQQENVSKLFYQATLPSYTVVSGQRLFLNPNFTKEYLEEKIDTSLQFGAIDLHQTVTRKIIEEIEIPKNYKVEALPTSKQLDNKYFSLSLNYNSKGNIVNCELTYIVKLIAVEKADVNLLNEFIDKAKKLHKDNIIFIKNE